MIDQKAFIDKIARRYKIRAQRLRGQNFLIDMAVVKKMIRIAAVKPTDHILEIGPGFGVLTKLLSAQAKSVTAIEIDKRLVIALKQIMADRPNVKIIEGDVLKIFPNLVESLPADYRIVANLPFQITSHFLRKFLETTKKPKDITLIIQQELAARICAQPGQLSLISLAVQLYGHPQMKIPIDCSSYWPRPRVDTVILKISNINQGLVHKFSQSQLKDFWRIARIGFSSRRKQLHNNLAAGLKVDNNQIKEIISKIGLNPHCRPQELSKFDWLRLFQEIKATPCLTK